MAFPELLLSSLSGGIEVTVHGENFDGVGELALMIRFEEEENTTVRVRTIVTRTGRLATL